MKPLHIKRKAFTMIELVFAIVVIGILASLAMPRIERDLVNEASTNILSDIRYTQHLALMDNKHMIIENTFNRAHNWQRRFWRIVFSRCTAGEYYMIGSDNDASGSNNAYFAQNESAIDPTNGNAMFGDASSCNANGGAGISDRMFITHKYGVDTVTSGGGCTGNGGTHIGFDYLGRPHYGFGSSRQPNSASYMAQDCHFKFTMKDGSDFNITITAETGHAFIVGQPDS
ncbi:MAG: Unknown protein [uncultured Sulfurovum sp.]|uniref:Periplasmic ATP /GTP-binding protein n=1 Tax=uncultured Sulfurovum sp. TaxID=269237 RepID=A0A6S6TU57_9BACT|nr:MAG: Unknown protein [uncultured Sulfurovum sp.]